MDNLYPARITLDRNDAKILTELQKDATIPIAALAERVGQSISPCRKRVQKLEKAGVILGRVARVNPATVGLGLMVLVEVEAADHTPRMAGPLSGHRGGIARGDRGAAFGWPDRLSAAGPGG